MNEVVHHLSNELLIKLLDKRVELERWNEAEIVDYIREVMHRRLWLEFGAASMFDFLTHAHFHYAPAVAQRRIDATRLMQVFPEVKEHLREGELNLTQLGMFASATRKRDVPLKVQREILQSIRGHTVRNTQVILNEAFGLEIKKRTTVREQSDGSVRAAITFSKEEWKDVAAAKDNVSHSVPNGELNKVVAYCCRFTSKAKTSVGGSNNVSKRRARRYTIQRDQSCQHRHPDGRICGSKYQLQVDHIVSRWKGGGDEIANLQLLCGVHNRYKYEREITHGRKQENRRKNPGQHCPSEEWNLAPT